MCERSINEVQTYQKHSNSTVGNWVGKNTEKKQKPNTQHLYKNFGEILNYTRILWRIKMFGLFTMIY